LFGLISWNLRGKKKKKKNHIRFSLLSHFFIKKLKIKNFYFKKIKHLTMSSSSSSTSRAFGWCSTVEIWHPEPTDLTHTLTLIDAVWSGDLGTVARLHSELGATFRADPLPQTSTLAIAVRTKNLAMLKLLLSLGANPNRIVSNSTPLGLATRIGSARFVKALLRAGADPVFGTNMQQLSESPMQIAIRLRRFRIISALLRATVASAPRIDELPIDMHLAAETACPKLIRLLRSVGGKIDEPNIDGHLPLHTLLLTPRVRPIDKEAFDLLMPPVVHLHTFVPRNGYRSNALVLAASNRASEHLVAPLIAAGSSPAITDWQNMTPLMHAAANNNQVAVRALLHSRAPFDIDQRDNRGRTALFIAAARDAAAIVRILLAFDADASVVGTDGNMPMEATSDIDVAAAIWAAGWPITSTRFFGSDMNVSKRRAFKQISLEKFLPLRARVSELCFAMQALDLPALITLAIIDHAVEYATDVPMFLKWNTITKVKHAKLAPIGK
jgi:ankyrin repeat protein